MTFGQVIASTRKDIGISQRELATKIVKEDGAPISPQYLNDIERDRRNPPGDHLLEQFARQLDLDKDYLYFLAGKLPFELRSDKASLTQVQDAFKAFRRTLRGE
jgi:transcriptional regulator with XRE-family HTH domain